MFNKLFSLFQSNDNIIEGPNLTFQTSAIKFKSIVEEAKEDLGSCERVIIIAHFEETLKRVEADFITAQIKFVLGPRYLPTQEILQHLSLTSFETHILLLSDALRTEPASKSESQVEVGSFELELIVVETSPDGVLDKHVGKYANSLPCKTFLRTYTALDEPLFTHFCGKRTLSLLRSLIPEESLALEHPMIKTALRKAQANVRRKCPKAKHTYSANEWFKRNLSSFT